MRDEVPVTRKKRAGARGRSGNPRKARIQERGEAAREPVRPGLVSATRPVPPSIPRPPYALTGVPTDDGSGEVRTADEIARMRHAGQVAAEILLLLSGEVAPGVTTDALDAIAHDAAIERGAYPSPLNYRGFPKSLCTSINEVICHGIPDSRLLREGDIVNLDVTVYVDGVHGDTSATFMVGEVSDEARMLVRETRAALYAGIAAVRPGGQVRDIGRAIELHAQGHGLSVVREFIGHGVGTMFHSGLAIPHYFDRRAVTEFVPGMSFTIEPMLNLGRPGVQLWDDEWTAVTVDGCLSAQFEHTLVVTDDGVEIMTLDSDGRCAADLMAEATAG